MFVSWLECKRGESWVAGNHVMTGRAARAQSDKGGELLDSPATPVAQLEHDSSLFSKQKYKALEATRMQVKHSR